MAYDHELADRMRDRLAPLRPREVAMFGGLGFMINGKFTVFAHGDGGMWLRCAPERVPSSSAKARKQLRWATAAPLAPAGCE